MAMFSKVKNKFNVKARLKVATLSPGLFPKLILRDSLHRITNMVLYILRLHKDTFKKST